MIPEPTLGEVYRLLQETRADVRVLGTRLERQEVAIAALAERVEGLRASARGAGVRWGGIGGSISGSIGGFIGGLLAALLEARR